MIRKERIEILKQAALFFSKLKQSNIHDKYRKESMFISNNYQTQLSKFAQTIEDLETAIKNKALQNILKFMQIKHENTVLRRFAAINIQHKQFQMCVYWSSILTDTKQKYYAWGKWTEIRQQVIKEYVRFYQITVKKILFCLTEKA